MLKGTELHVIVGCLLPVDLPLPNHSQISQISKYAIHTHKETLMTKNIHQHLIQPILADTFPILNDNPSL